MYIDIVYNEIGETIASFTMNLEEVDCYIDLIKKYGFTKTRYEKDYGDFLYDDYEFIKCRIQNSMDVIIYVKKEGE